MFWRLALCLLPSVALAADTEFVRRRGDFISGALRSLAASGRVGFHLRTGGCLAVSTSSSTTCSDTNHLRFDGSSLIYAAAGTTLWSSPNSTGGFTSVGPYISTRAATSDAFDGNTYRSVGVANASLPTCNGSFTGRFIRDTTNDCLAYCNGTSWACLARTSGTATTAYDLVQDETAALTRRTTINFTGNGVAAADNAGTSATDVTIRAGSSWAATCFDAACPEDVNWAGGVRANGAWTSINVVCSCDTAGAVGGGSNGFTVSVYDVTGSAVLCSGALASFSCTDERIPRGVDCNGTYTSGNIYTLRYSSTCGTNPGQCHCSAVYTP